MEESPNGSSEQQEPRIGFLVAGLLLIVGGLFDGAQFIVGWIPFVDVVLLPVIGFFAIVIFWIWFMLIDPSLMVGRKSFSKQMTFAGMSISTVLPFWDMLPEITAGVLGVILISRLEDMGLTFADLAKMAYKVSKNPVMGGLEVAKSLATGKKPKTGKTPLLLRQVGGDRKVLGGRTNPPVRRSRGYEGPNRNPVASPTKPPVRMGKRGF